MAIITMLVGLGVLLAFTVLGCVLEVFLARRESIWPGLVLPILAGLYAVVMVLSYTVAPDTPWNQVLGGVLAVFLVSGIPAFLLLMVFFICRSGRRRKKHHRPGGGSSTWLYLCGHRGIVPDGGAACKAERGGDPGADYRSPANSGDLPVLFRRHPACDPVRRGCVRTDPYTGDFHGCIGGFRHSGSPAVSV